jgi:hypothetical protein
MMIRASEPPMNERRSAWDMSGIRDFMPSSTGKNDVSCNTSATDMKNSL